MSSGSYRPNPDELLEGIKKAQDKTKRGKLKIFFGMCPGVGKTFSMLRAAREKQASGTKILVGLVETHQRAETQGLLQGLDVLPRRKVEYKGTLFEEFDLDHALEMKPEIILVDELAHTNAPGSRHEKRYQDIQDLLFAGINVYTTMNVQHVESRADLVYQISGVPVRETVPDSFLEYADQIELIDISPEELIRRLNEGKVYLGERAERAAENFFKEEKLTALRELALRFTAEIVDDQLRDHMQTKRILGPWNTNERLMVAISHSPFSSRLIRSTRRMAYNLEAPWVALYVDTGSELETADHETLVKNLNLARELGAEVITTKDHSVVEALKRVAAEKNVTQIVLGRPDRSFIRDLLGKGNVLDELVNETSEVDIHVIRQKRKPVYRGFHIRLPRLNSKPALYLSAVVYIGLLGFVGYALRETLGYRAIGFGFLLGIMPVTTFAGFGPTFLAAILSSLVWNYFFIPPQFTFIVGDTEDVMMIASYFAVATVTGFLASRIKRQERDLLQRERKANILYEFGRKLAEAKTDEELAMHAVESIEAVFLSKVIILKGAGEKLSPHPLSRAKLKINEKDFAVAAWTYANQKKAGWRTDTLSSSECLCLPLRGRSFPVGVLILYPKESRSLTLDQENLIETISGHLATALEREELESQSRKTEVYEQSEKLHQTLLNTVSHELRTPLTSIIGGATALKELKTSPSAELRSGLVEDIVESAERLNNTIENLMDMSRISSGVLKLNTELFELNDFLRSVTQSRPRLFQRHRLKLELSEENLFIKGDEKVLEHVFLNLIANAVQYSPQDSTVLIRTRQNQSYAEFSILDEGKGLTEEETRKIFDRFYRSPNSPPGGVGLGLSISKALIEAHGGAVFADNRTDGKVGAAFTIIIPLQSIPKEVLQ